MQKLPYDLTHVIKADQFDIQNFEEVTDGTFFKTLALRGSRQVNHNFPYLIEDVFQSLFQYKPIAQKENEHTQRNAKLLGALSEQKEFKDMREITKLDEFQSALATAKFIETILEKSKEDENLENMLKQKDADEKEQEKQLAAFRKAIRSAMNEMQQEVDEVQEVMSALGVQAGKLSEKLGKGSFDTRKATIEKMVKNKKLLDIARKVGKLHRIMRSTKMTQSKYARQEIIGITQSNDVARMTPRELMLMKKTRLDWNRRYVNRTLATYEMQGKVPAGKGPVCVCLDKSFSMSGENDDWATAIMFSVLLEAQKDKRDAYICMFNGGIMHERSLTAGKYSIQDLMELASFLPAGGTNFAVALEGSLAAIQKDEKLRKADIVFVTDGDDTAWETSDFTQRFLAEKKKRDISMFTILVAGVRASIAKISDEVFEVHELVETTASEVVQKIANGTTI